MKMANESNEEIMKIMIMKKSNEIWRNDDNDSNINVMKKWWKWRKRR